MTLQVHIEYHDIQKYSNKTVSSFFNPYAIKIVWLLN